MTTHRGLTTATDTARCGYGFKKNKQYLVYAYGQEGSLSTNICTRTRPLANAEGDLTELDAAE